ncbi:MAG: PEGA domain-containing protein, partial [Labilithrix sp.]|nr:PEGA domain-containing protein [Labilithrix sp.]
MNALRRLVVSLVLLALVALARSAHAVEPDEDPTALARVEYARGNDLARAMQWGEALGAFEASLRVRPHALTLYNVGVCERVLGRATRARQSFRQALARAEADPSELAPSLREEAAGFVAEYGRVLARVPVKLSPSSAGLAVDGRPLRERREGDRFVLEAGLEAPGIGQPPPSEAFDLELDPGTHVITVSRSGYRDVVVTRDFAGGRGPTLLLVLARLPATLHVSASQPNALVRVGPIDVGLAPVDVVRPPGSYRVVVSREGYTTFVNDVTLAPGAETALRAELAVERVPLTKRWWFWSAAAVVLAGAAVATYAITRAP